jgi:hypothetical protein
MTFNKKYRLTGWFIAIISFIVFQSFAQQKSVHTQKEFFGPTIEREPRRNDKEIRVMFYNVENLFDVVNDSLKNDDEYTKSGLRHWNYSRLERKINNISKVVISIGVWQAPEIIGLCEVENRYVLSQLALDSPLKNFGYKIIHRDSPDPRGIDVAMLYLPEKLTPVETHYIGIQYPFEPGSRTRDILYVKGLIFNTDTIHIFVNHWPSRFGGYSATTAKRKYVAEVLRKKVDSIMKIQPNARILIMGDFNDEAKDESISKGLKAKSDSLNLQAGELYDMMTGAGSNWNHGTIKDKELWLTIDQFIVSASLLNDKKGAHTTPHSVHILDAPFLLQSDDTWFGQKPFRTYYGPKYLGGFSDHLPIYMDLYK